MSYSLIHDLVEEGKEVETPTSWLYWASIVAVSALAKNYSLVALKGNLVYYPNIYVMLLGESGLGKGYPCNFAKRLVQAADCTRVIAGRSSIQAIVKELATAKTSQGKPLITDSRGFIVNGELSTAIIQDPDALTILTDLYDGQYNKEWTNLLKGDGPEKLKEPYISCLFGSSPAHFYDSVPAVNIEGGYIGRNLIVFEEKRSRDLDLLDDSNGEDIDDDKFTKQLLPKYLPHLQRIASNEKRKLVPDEKARIYFNAWRREWRGTQAAYNDKTGFVNRVPDHVLKVAMCLCLARYDNNGFIIENDIREAVSSITKLVYNNKKAAEGSGTDPLAAQTKKIVDFLLAAPQQELTRTELLVKGYGNYDPPVLDRILDALLEMKWVKKTKVGIGSNLDYIIHLSGEPLQSYLKFKEMQKGALH